MGVRGSDAMRVRMHFYKEIPPVGSKIYTTPPAAQKAIEFGMHGKKMMFKVGVQQFTLDHEPDTQDEFNFMRDMLVHAFSTFTPDVKTTQPAPARPAVPLTDDELDVCRQWFNSIKDTNGGYLTGHDYALAEKLHMHLGLRVPDSVKQATPPAQPAVPLTDDQINTIRFSISTKAVTQRDFELARAIEAAHGITEKGQP
jgi:hypothetical protein